MRKPARDQAGRRRWTLVGLRGLALVVAAAQLFLTGCGTADGGTEQAPDGQVQPAAPLGTPEINQRPSATPPGAQSSSLCGTVSEALWGELPDLHRLAWSSAQIVRGTVIQQLPSTWGQPYTSGDPNKAPMRPIVTEFVVRVDERMRGIPADTVRVRMFGGTIGDCTMMRHGEPVFQVGEQAVLFLASVDRTAPIGPDTVYTLVGGPQGRWNVMPDGNVVPAMNAQRLIPDVGASGLPVSELARRVHAALRANPPAVPADSDLPIVPLDRAPLP